MFRETLIESSPQLRKRSRWPMATALTLQIIGVILLIIVPLATTGVIPLSARIVDITPPTYRPTAPPSTSTPSGGGGGIPTTRSHVVAIVNLNPGTITYGHKAPPGDDPVADPTACCPGRGPFNGFHVDNSIVIPTQPVEKLPIKVSHLSEALLVNKVVPAYPSSARSAGIQGDVKLHAIIARDGSIQSLSLISGQPLLARAAITAVEQWRYHPYILNGEPVEVETWITVSFTKSN